jgi:AraC family transcriptional regulator of adaptative response/methylated-DNA-[protein]-cysteine methyltransferase
MITVSQRPNQSKKAYSSDEDSWHAVVNRDPAADGAFFYSVQTTGVYCRPVCAARLPLRGNVRFHATGSEAERAGFRPCKRCKPTEDSLAKRRAAVVAQACRMIEEADEPLSLNELADSVGMSACHFHRVFKAHTGLTPKAYAAAHRARRVRNELARSATITDAIYAAGFNSNSRFYESSIGMLGMAPKTFHAGGGGAAIRFAIGECWLGSILVAKSEKGICAISLGDDPEELARDLQDQFPKAELIGGDAQFEQLVAKVVGLLETLALGLDLPLDIRGTAFQQRVWKALQAIPPGSTASYTDIAKRIGQPNSVRAVAQACGANILAVAIPCHRVVRTDGSLSGYRWGVERKAELLKRERTTRNGH